MTDTLIIEKAIEEVETKTFGVTEQFLAIHKLVYIDNKPKVERVDTDKVDEAIVYFNPRTLEHKKLDSISEEQVRNAFGGNNVSVLTDSSKMMERFRDHSWQNVNLLMMSSGTFGGLDLKKIAELILH